jgi:hypothetical protein
LDSQLLSCRHPAIGENLPDEVWHFEKDYCLAMSVKAGSSAATRQVPSGSFRLAPEPSWNVRHASVATVDLPPSGSSIVNGRPALFRTAIYDCLPAAPELEQPDGLRGCERGRPGQFFRVRLPSQVVWRRGVKRSRRAFPVSASRLEIPFSGVPVGVDLGIRVFAKLSTGEEVFAPVFALKPLKKAHSRLKRLNRRLARTQRASKNHRKAAMRPARQHRRVRNIRQDFLHKFTTKLAKHGSEICMEDLNVSGMAKNHSHALHIQDAAWGETRR